MPHCVILLAMLAQALPVSPTGRPTPNAVNVQVDPAHPVPITGNISASSSAHSTTAAPTYVDGTDNPFSSDLAGSLRVICMSGTCGGASPFADSAAFTAGATSVSVIAGVFNDSLTALASGKAAAPRQTSFRAMHFNMRDNSGNEIPFPAALDADLGFKVHVQNTVAVTGPLTDVQLRASAVPTTDAHTTAAAPLSLRLSDGAAFYDATKTGQLPAALDGSGFLKIHEQGNANVVGAAASGAAKGGNPVQIGGVFNTTQPTVTTGQAVEAQATARGAQIVATGADTFNATVSGTVTTSPPANASTNVAQLAGTTTDTNSGNKSAGTLRVVLATDQPALTNKLLVTPDSVALPANQSVNVNQINAVTPLMGNGPTGTGSQRVTIASDNTAFAVNAAATQGTGSTANPWAVQGTVADGVNIAGNPVPVGYKSVAVASAPTTVTAGQETYGIGSVERIPYVRAWHPNLIACNVAVSTATTITAFGGSCAAPGAGLSIYITDITFSASAASGTAADAMPTIKSGTGGTCGTGTAVVIEQFNPANGGWNVPFQTPYRVPANSELCWIDSTAGSKAVHLHGFIAP